MLDPTRPLRRATLVAVTVLALSACSGGATSPTPGSPTPPAATASPTAPPATGPLTADEAVRLVKAQDPRFAAAEELRSDVIGQSAWYEVSPGTVGYQITVTIGWGDCQAGCISRHTWTYAVTPDRAVSLVREAGDTPPPAVTVPPGLGTTGIAGTAHAGPTCPVIQNPPDPACAERPVAGATIVVRDATGAEVARVVTAADGSFVVALRSGAYSVEAQPVEGLMGTPAPISVTVPAGATEATIVDVAYDTGIR